MKEYSYEIDKYIVGVDSNGEDGIGLTIATMKDNKLCILGSCYGDNARYIDLLIKENQSLKKENKILRENAEHNDKVVDKVNWENKELKKQLEEYKYSHSCSFADTCKNVKITNYNQQKEFINYMMNTIENITHNETNDEEIKGYLIQRGNTFKEILSKYKEIIGVFDEK